MRRQFNGWRLGVPPPARPAPEVSRLLPVQVESPSLPAWTALSVLVHADRRRLASLERGRGDVPDRLWGGAVGRLAGCVLAAVGDEADLRRLRRDVLIPLELWLLEATLPPATPGALEEMVRAAVTSGWRSASRVGGDVRR